jgi:hypothetical protein
LVGSAAMEISHVIASNAKQSPAGRTPRREIASSPRSSQ